MFINVIAKRWLVSLMLIGLMGLNACSEEVSSNGQSDVQFEITDAPSDDANIKSVMVTVAEVRVDGKPLPGIARQTIDLKAYSEGRTEILGTSTLENRSYSNITLVLDLESDANGNTPGCYVQTLDNTKYKLQNTASGQLEITTTKSWKVVNNYTNRIVIDFDLRKSIRHEADAALKYSFVTMENLQNAVRPVTILVSGAIEGSYENTSNVEADQIIVYAYKKGTFNADIETQPQGTDEIRFRNAVTSAEVKSALSGNTFTLAFLETGEYELHFVAYNRDQATGRTSFAARLQSQTTINGSISDIVSVKAGTNLQVSTSVTGIL